MEECGWYVDGMRMVCGWYVDCMWMVCHEMIGGLEMTKDVSVSRLSDFIVDPNLLIPAPRQPLAWLGPWRAGHRFPPSESPPSGSAPNRDLGHDRFLRGHLWGRPMNNIPNDQKWLKLRQVHHRVANSFDELACHSCYCASMFG